jgi:hypothetical protein
MAINLKELQALLEQATAAAANEKEIRKSLGRVEHLVSNITKELTSIYELLDRAALVRKERTSNATAEAAPEAPYGRRKDGTPREKPGRGKKE